MEVVSKKKLVLVTGRANLPLAEEVAGCLHVDLGEVVLATFANGEIYARYGESIRGADVFILQSHCEPINDHLMEQLIMIDAAKRASAKRITAVCPFYGYSRQDKKSEGREPITARLVADMISVAGADRVVTVDLHQGQIQGFFDKPVDHLTALPLLTTYLQEQISSDMVVVSPDAGGVKRAQKFANHLNADLGLSSTSAAPGAPTTSPRPSDVVGEVAGRTCVLVDDMIDTASTIACRRRPAPGQRGARGLRGRHPRTPLRSPPSTG